MHGPSWLDSAGILLMLLAWLVSCVITILRWKKITKRLNNNLYLLPGIYFLSVCGIVLALTMSFEWLLWSCVVTASAVNILLFAFSLKPQQKIQLLKLL